MFEVRRCEQCKPMTDEDRLLVSRVQQAWFSASDRTVLGSGRRIVNRMGDRKKDAFVQQFVAEDRLSSYPADEADCADENAFPDDPSAPDPPGARQRSSLVATLASEIERAYALTGERGPAPDVVAGSLLRSEHSVERLDVRSTDPSALGVPFVLAHLEALGYGLGARLSASIARRATLVLLAAGSAKESAA